MTPFPPSFHPPTTAAAEAVLDRLEQAYPDAHCALIHADAWQLLVATVLSAQCTDVRVNRVTPVLFARWPGPAALAGAPVPEVAAVIHSVGCFNTKARHLVHLSQQLRDRHQGQVPAQMEQLVALPGVGRKTANVVLGTAFGIPGMVVDTHVKRLSRRLGWTRAEDPLRIEQDLCRLLPPRRWTRAGHTLIQHGRSCCRATTPLCGSCPILPLCPRIGVRVSR
jgi:endonuclease-3